MEGYRKMADLIRKDCVTGPELIRCGPHASNDREFSEPAFIEYLRVFMRYPEVLAWNHFWHEHQLNIQKNIYDIVKAFDSSKTVGWHLWHRGRAFSPLMRAEEDYEDLADISDFIKPAIFTHPAGARFAEEVFALKDTILADLETDEIAGMLYKFCGYSSQGSVSEMKDKPFGTSYLKEEIRMARARLKGRARLYAGIAAADYSSWNKTPPSSKDIKADIRAAAEAGAEGIIFGSIDLVGYGEAAGEGLVEIGWAT